ncbi:hypothetical protein PAPHI01_0889 [Pancytospora philotis]|nr:hypothetical protein PAPHI01_0889 [Pancytospora philotis]
MSVRTKRASAASCLDTDFGTSNHFVCGYALLQIELFALAPAPSTFLIRRWLRCPPQHPELDVTSQFEPFMMHFRLRNEFSPGATELTMKHFQYLKFLFPHMLLGTIFLLLARCHAAEHDEAAVPPAIATTDYTEFGKIGDPELNTLEKQVLEQLWINCVGYTSPEIPLADINSSARRPSSNGKTCCLLYSVLKDTDQHDRPNRVLERLLGGVGFSGHMLLKKLLNSFYIRHLAIVAEYFLDARNQLAELIRTSVGLLKSISGEVDEKARYGRTVDLAQYAREKETVSCVADYVLLIRNKYILYSKSFVMALSHLFDYWFNDYEFFTLRFTTISECISIILESKILPSCKLLDFKDQLARHIIDKEQPEYLDFLLSLMDKRQVRRLVFGYLNAYDFDSFNPQFVLNFIAFLPQSGPETLKVVARTWEKYLEDVPAFLRRETAFKDKLFARLPPCFQRDVLVHLNTLPEKDPFRDNTAYNCIRRLDCGMFLGIISKYKNIKKQNELMDFMLNYLDIDVASEFISCCDSDECYNGIPYKRIGLASRLSSAIKALVEKASYGGGASASC